VTKGLYELLIQELEAFFKPLTVASESADGILNMLYVLGWDMFSLPGSDQDEIISIIKDVVDAAGGLNALLEIPASNLEAMLSALDSIVPGIVAIRELGQLEYNEGSTFFEDLPAELINALTIFYLHDRSPFLYCLLRLFTVIYIREEDLIIEGELTKSRQEMPYIDPGKLPDVLVDPAKVLGAEYWPDGLPDLETTNQAAEKFFGRLAAVLSTLGFVCAIGTEDRQGEFSAEDEERMQGLLTIRREVFSFGLGDTVLFGATLGLLPETEGGPGVTIIPFEALELNDQIEGWHLEFDITGAAGGFQITDEDIEFLGAETASKLDAGLTFSRLPSGNSGYPIGGTSGTRLEIAELAFTGNIAVSSKSQEYSIYALFDCVHLMLKAEDGDGFIQRILPSADLDITFDLAVGWSNIRGLHFRGGAGLDMVIPVQRSLFSLTVESIHIGIKFDESKTQAIVAANLSVQLGPVTAVAGGFGLAAAITSPENGGNLGLLNLDFGFELPTLIGLSVDAQGVSGGGVLKIDPPNYAGMLQLSFRNEIELTAFALLTTKLPDGMDGFSLVIQIMAEFQPIQIGLGFALTGVGGLIGINRQMSEEGLKAAFKTHSLDAILFPKNPIKDAVKIIESIQSIMPPREGYHVFGPMVQLYWGGSIRLVEFEVGIFIQIGGPLKVLILGQARSRLPNAEFPRLVINLDVLGILDFGEDSLAIDAVLFDSKLLSYALDGKMALRADWTSGEENFALSIGGFHPQFHNIPPGFPQLTRLMVTIGSGNPRLTLQMYLAITPNTLQVGARFELWAKKLGFTITGGASFNALFTFSPFSFLVAVEVWVNIKRGFVDLGAWLSFELSGPNPLIAAGYVKFKVGPFSKKVRFRKQFGDEKPDLLPVVSPLAALREALEHPGTLRAQLPSWASANLIFVEDAENKIDPVADIIILQRAVPLNLELEKFGGGRPPEAEKRLSITAGLDPKEEIPTQTLFAPEQFKNWSDDVRLSAKPFENYDAGIRFSGDYIIPSDAIEERAIEYETVLRESRAYRDKLQDSNYRKAAVRTTCVWKLTASEANFLTDWSLLGAQSYFKPLRKVKEENRTGYIKVREPRFNIVGADTHEGKLSPVEIESKQDQNNGLSYAKALEASEKINDEAIIILNTADMISG
jgi:hypothetical protein